MARGSHSFTCHPHVYPRMEWAILRALRTHSPDGVARGRWRTSGSAYYSSIDPERMKGWVGVVGWHYSGWFTSISGHPSATGRAWDRESSPAKDRRSTTVQHKDYYYYEAVGTLQCPFLDGLFRLVQQLGTGQTWPWFGLIHGLDWVGLSLKGTHIRRLNPRCGDFPR